MPRVARAVFAGVPHHVTQRGNRRADVFFSDDDRRAYLAWLKDYADAHGVEILAYCLMDNHVHVVAVPAAADGLQRVFKPLHMRYAQHLNRRKGWTGHLWQGRFFSSPLDDDYTWAAIRYVERNPVRAGLVRRAENHPWSSAAAHCGLAASEILTRRRKWTDFLARGTDDWSAWLAEGDEQVELSQLRRNIDKGLPCGEERFLDKLSRLAGRVLHYRPRGRPKTREEPDKKG